MGLASASSSYCAAKWNFRALFLACLLAPLSACSNDTSPHAPPPGDASPSIGQPAAQQASIANIAQAAPACPSEQFGTFLKAFVNSADLQDAFSAHPLRYKYPYYWKHNTQPGDPAHPKWIVDERPGPARVRYRYDAASDRFVWSGRDLKSGQRWTSIRTDETNVSYAALPDFEIRRVSDVRYEVEYDEGDIDTYELSLGCWRYVERWEREAIVDCKWPDECRKQREHEEPLR